MTYAQYQEHFEQMAAQEKERLSALAVAELIALIRSGRLGTHYQIWYSLAERAKPAEVNDMLMSFLYSDEEYLHRYHCAAALIAVNSLSSTGWEPHHLSAGPKYPVKENLEKIRGLLKNV